MRVSLAATSKTALVAVALLVSGAATQSSASRAKEKPKIVPTWLLCHGTASVVRGKVIEIHPEMCSTFDFKTEGAGTSQTPTF